MDSQSQIYPNQKVLGAFIEWIELKDSRHATAWAHRYNADPEAAMCEASFWAVLTDCGVTVEPNADLTGSRKAPDFVCYSGDVKFFVEVTCIHIETATKHTRLPHVPPKGHSGGPWKHLNDLIFGEVRTKTTQCANLDAPCLLGIGTFHFLASDFCVNKMFAEWLLTGESNLAWNIDARTGDGIGPSYQLTHLKSATSVRPSRLTGIEPARRPISAIVLAGFGCTPPPILGALHFDPVREFDPSSLPRIPFCRLKVDFGRAEVSTVWIQESKGSAETTS